MIRIGDIQNYYGGLWVMADGGKFFWSIESYTGHHWDEIPQSLYQSLLEYEHARKDGTNERTNERQS